MTPATPFAERIRMAFSPTPRGVVGLVDDLLCLCRSHQLRIQFAEGQCSVRRLGADETDAISVPLPKPVFRAAIARIAALCNEQHPGSVTPYRGEGEVIVPSPHATNCSPSTCYVSFVNTSSEQHLEMRFSRSSVDGITPFTVILHDQRTVTVFGHALKYIQHENTNDSGSYGILTHSNGTEVLVGLFRISEVVGVFSGELRASTESVPATVGREAQRLEAANAPTWPI
jgi:hypothetical protein